MHRIKRIHQVLHKPLLLLSNEAWGLHHTLTERHENRIPHSQDRTALTGADYKWVFIGKKIKYLLTISYLAYIHRQRIYTLSYNVQSST